MEEFLESKYREIDELFELNKNEYILDKKSTNGEIREKFQHFIEREIDYRNNNFELKEKINIQHKINGYIGLLITRLNNER